MPDIPPPSPMTEPPGWACFCFHCGETFTTKAQARAHFGADYLDLAGCQIKASDRGLLGALREAEAQLERYRAEDSDKDREMGRMQSDHATALRREEEKGYARGLRDGRAIPADAPVEREAQLERTAYAAGRNES